MIVGGINAVVGCFVVVRGMSFFGDALAHAILPGVALSYTASGGFVAGNLFVGGLGAGILSALVIAWLTRNEELKEDSAIGIVFVTMFALGIAIISTQSSYAVDLTHILFGSINAISQDDLLTMTALAAIVLLAVLLLYKEFLLVSFDLSLAHSLRLPVQHLKVLLLVLVAVTIVASLQAVGIALMLALLITPAATARLAGQAAASHDCHRLHDRRHKRHRRLLRLVLFGYPVGRLHRADLERHFRPGYRSAVQPGPAA